MKILKASIFKVELIPNSLFFIGYKNFSDILRELAARLVFIFSS
ncbi:MULTISPECIES: hypothetical protein [unclassified Helicobacter]|nr:MULTISPECIES: hypothetical protein [unclassified Helicobacter]